MSDVKNVITLGIGASPGSLLWFFTGGLEAGEAVSATPQVTLTLPERHLTFTLDRRDFASYLTGAILTEAGELIFTEAGNRLETEASTESGSGFSLHERALTLTLERKP